MLRFLMPHTKITLCCPLRPGVSYAPTRGLASSTTRLAIAQRVSQQSDHAALSSALAASIRRAVASSTSNLITASSHL